MTFASYGLLEDLLVRYRGVGDAVFVVLPENFFCVSAVGSTSADRPASQSRLSLPTVTSLVATSVSEGDAGVRQMSANELNLYQNVNVAEVPDLEDVPLAVLVQQQKLRKEE